MLTEYATITVVKYRDADGLPTCAANFINDKVCKFYTTQRFGMNETCCVAGDKSGEYWEVIKRRGNGCGFLEPLKNCPVWPAAEESDPPPSKESQK